MWSDRVRWLRERTWPGPPRRWEGVIGARWEGTKQDIAAQARHRYATVAAGFKRSLGRHAQLLARECAYHGAGRRVRAVECAAGPCSKHGIRVGGCVRDRLEYVPVLHDPARRIQAEDVDPGPVAIAGPLLVTVQDDIVALPDDPLELDPLARYSRAIRVKYSTQAIARTGRPCRSVRDAAC